MTDPTIGSQFSPPQGRPVAQTTPVNDAVDIDAPRDVETPADHRADHGADHGADRGLDRGVEHGAADGADVKNAVETGATAAGSVAHDASSHVGDDALGDVASVDNGDGAFEPQPPDTSSDPSSSDLASSDLSSSDLSSSDLSSSNLSSSNLSSSNVSPSGLSPSEGWWRRNRIALVAILILVPATGLAIFGKGLRTSRSVRPTDPITVEAGESAAYSGATVGPTVATFTGDRSAAPNTRVVRVTTSIANGGDLYCNGLTLRELTGAKRVWQTAFESFATDESALLYCDPTQSGPYDLQSFFVVPDDASGPFAVELYVTELLPQYVQFVVNPAADG